MRQLLVAVAAFGLMVTGCTSDPVEPTLRDEESARSLSDRVAGSSERVVVANRSSGTISVIDAGTNTVAGTFDLPSEKGDMPPEPMYVVYARRFDRVFVGDRANDRVAVFDARTFDVVGTAPAGDGVFHMWADPRAEQLWVNNDVDNTTSVIDPGDLSIIATVQTPPDLVAMGGKPHDVIVEPHGNFAYVTVVGVAGDNDYVIQYSTSSFEEVNRAPVGKDPHVSLARQHDFLYVPCQNSDVVVVLSRTTMEELTRIEIPGAHGAGMSHDGRFFYTANLPGGGTDALFTIDTRRNTALGAATDSPFPVPHNIALTRDNRRLFLTHSGSTSDKVTVYQMHGADPVPEFLAEIAVGSNPFGIALAP